MEIYSDTAGVVIEYLVGVGDEVEDGQEVISLESMKMEIPVVATTSGTVKELTLSPGDFVNEGDLILVLE